MCEVDPAHRHSCQVDFRIEVPKWVHGCPGLLAFQVILPSALHVAAVVSPWWHTLPVLTQVREQVGCVALVRAVQAGGPHCVEVMELLLKHGALLDGQVSARAASTSILHGARAVTRLHGVWVTCRASKMAGGNHGS